ncbi:hypothetical protein Ctob_015877 [Chrysochromulina tobinii]|uniref:Uncharacterized protein n=1 Tax=Chrysochromulina tobinii TaxID=1460289 RepID=A0A0M0JXE7_9EUKA|nr:hypothetical protein Ctob_015877 [Chrysochromulina tobinii]|eukprot:KOO30957.1 hypothetical protein Ctob_015877 [Chrysochromulina sp. CCMP291]
MPRALIVASHEHLVVPDEGGHQRSSEVIRAHQRLLEVISGHQWSSEVISGHKRSSEVIRGNQGHPRSSGRAP